jgi:hypothetical protein
MTDRYERIRAALASAAQPAVPLLAADHKGIRVDYTGLLGQCQRALRHTEPALAEMLRQLQGHLTELGQRWYAGDTAVVDEILQLYCIEDHARAALSAAEAQASGQAAPSDMAHEIWAAAQTSPGEGIEDAVIRIAHAVAPLQAEIEAQQQDKLDAERWRYIRRRLCLTGNGDGTCVMHAINLPANIQGWPEPGQVAEFCDAAIDAAIDAALRERLGEGEQ